MSGSPIERIEQDTRMPTSPSRTALYDRCIHTLARAGAAANHAVFFVPGRIEVLGKHTDYAGGRSLLCAIDRGIVLVAAARADSRVNVTDVLSRQTREVGLDAEQAVPRGDWAAYPATVARRVARNFPAARRGADIAFASNLPAASGMSSSSALTIAVFLALSAINELPAHPQYRASITAPESLAAYLAAVENGLDFGTLASDLGVGTQGGGEDHTAILCCRAGFLSQYAFCPIRLEREISFPGDCTFVMAFSGVAAPKTGSALAAYNAAALTARTLLNVWNQATGRTHDTLGAAIACDPLAADQLRALIAHAEQPADSARLLVDRLDQFLLECCTVIPRAADAFAAGNLAGFGELVDRSQYAAETLLRNQVPETVSLARFARQAGALAASAFGAGFGGSVWALVSTADAHRFAEQWQADYERAHPLAAARAQFIITRPGPAASALPPGHQI